MQMRRLGKTELQVSAVSYGCIKLPQIDEESAAECLNLALDLGINYFDTARNYRDSEEKIGKGIGHRRSEFHLASKTTNRTADGLREEAQGASPWVRSLQAIVVDLLDDDVNNTQVKRSGKVVRVTCSVDLSLLAGEREDRG